MTLNYAFAWLGAVGLVLALNACRESSTTSSQPPPAPEMPAYWKVVSDFEVPTEQIKAIEVDLGAKISALRNTVYEVQGKKVQINIIVAADAQNADKLMAKLLTMKSQEALLREGLLIYEFVGPNDVLPYIREGREQIASGK